MTERPEFQADDPRAEEHRPAGPVPQSGSPSSQAAGGDPDSAPPAGEAAEKDVERDLEALLGDAEAQRDEYLDIARRAQADFENYRKRMAAEVQAAALRGKAEVARGMIDAVDNLERALQHEGIDPDANDPLEGGNTAEVKNPEGLAHGVLLVFFGMRETLRRNGIEVVDPKGEKFDPNFAEALSTVQVEGTEAGVVVEVMQKGYRFEGQLIRPAMVVVAA
ncbi:MAG TPA: nucleotide exchange factor GrpE [Solirubrobacterales bacterium]|jgi:molecular chaperone GrpE|nr:nucleotide exchange factor GrpE [Solirubrobacterales bacterium]